MCVLLGYGILLYIIHIPGWWFIHNFEYFMGFRHPKSQVVDARTVLSCFGEYRIIYGSLIAQLSGWEETCKRWVMMLEGQPCVHMQCFPHPTFKRVGSTTRFGQSGTLDYKGIFHHPDYQVPVHFHFCWCFYFLSVIWVCNNDGQIFMNHDPPNKGLPLGLN